MISSLIFSSVFVFAAHAPMVQLSTGLGVVVLHALGSKLFGPFIEDSADIDDYIGHAGTAFWLALGLCGEQHWLPSRGRLASEFGPAASTRLSARPAIIVPQRIWSNLPLKLVARISNSRDQLHLRP